MKPMVVIEAGDESSAPTIVKNNAAKGKISPAAINLLISLRHNKNLITSEVVSDIKAKLISVADNALCCDDELLAISAMCAANPEKKRNPQNGLKKNIREILPLQYSGVLD